MLNKLALSRLAAAAALVIALPGGAAAQYFGQNKVQYKQFDFQVLKTEHFDIYFYPTEREGIDIAARMAERWHARLERLFEHQLRGRQPLVLYASHPDFEQTNAIQGELGEGTGGVTEPLRRRIVLPLGGPLADTDHVIGHELVHAFQFDITTRPERASRRRTAPNGCRCGSSKAWRSTCRSGRSTRTPPCGCATPRAARKKPADDRRPRQPEVLPVSLGPGVLGVRRRQWGDDVIRADAAHRGGGRRHRTSRSKRVLGVTTKELSEDWHASIRADLRAGARGDDAADRSRQAGHQGGKASAAT